MAEHHRQDAPVMPSCPVCGSNEAVSRDTIGAQKQRIAWLCGGCWSVFDGSQGEWAHHHEDRDRIKRRREAQQT